MRRTVGPILAALVLLVNGATAEPSRVISGEHDGFTRLVAVVPEGSQWRAEKRGRKVKIVLEGHAEGFDTEGVYPRIRRDRITALDPQESVLSLTLGCDCAVVAFSVGKSHVALDVITNVETTRSGRLAEMPEDADPPHPEVEVASRPTVKLPTVFPSRTSAPEPSGTLPRQALTIRELSRLSDIRQELARELGGAATRGLLEQVPGFRAGPADPQPEEAQPAQMESTPAEIPTEDVRNIRISSSRDLPEGIDPALEHMSLSGHVCPPKSDFDLAAWGNDLPFHAQIGPARDALFGEFDRLDQAAALRLARLYLHFGFGAEAKQVLFLDPSVSSAHPLLLAVAEIMENDHAANPGPLRALIDCDSNAALWAILAERDLNLPQTIDPGPALLALNELPVHLRQFIAPALSQRLRSHGDASAATVALRSLERLPQALPPAAKLARAEVALDEGRTDEATAGMAQVAEGNSEKSPQALVALVDARIAEGKPISFETAKLVEAYAKELRDSDMGSEMRRAHVLALAKSSQFDAAFEAMRTLGGIGDDDASVALRATLVEELTAAADDVVFLDHMFQQTKSDIAGLPLRAQLSLAERYLDLGFAPAAQGVLDAMGERQRNPARQELTARVALAMEQPARAEAALIGLESGAADLLRARARQMSGDHETAHALFEQTDQPEDAAETAWLSENWRDLTNPETPVFGPVAALPEPDLAASQGTEGMLARSTAALEESNSTRQLLAEFLQAPTLLLGDAAVE